MNYVMFDSGCTHGDSNRWQESFKKRNIPLCVFQNKGGWGYKLWLIDAIRFVNSTTSNDVLICWADIQGVFAYWYSLLTFKRRRIVIVNILLKNKATLKNRLTALLYKKALNARSVAYTVTARKYGETLSKRLKVKKTDSIVHDWFDFSISLNCSPKVKKPFEKYMFSGGRNGRDWEMVYNVACKLTDKNFCLVMNNADYTSYFDKFSKLCNCTLYHDIPFTDYCALLQGSSLAYFPLDTQAPAGLTAIFQAVAMRKPVLTSNTEVTREYFSEFPECMANEDINEHIEKLKYLADGVIDIDMLVRHLSTCCGEKQYMNGIIKCIDKFDNNKR